jgi:hypothetical protein
LVRFYRERRGLLCGKDEEERETRDGDERSGRERGVSAPPVLATHVHEIFSSACCAPATEVPATSCSEEESAGEFEELRLKERVRR